MTADEIKSAYADLSPSDAFEAFDAAGVDNATVAVVLGQEVAQEFGHWIYATLE